jgi:hypothetical protein
VLQSIGFVRLVAALLILPKRWFSVICFVCLFIVGTVSLGIGHNLLIGLAIVNQR